MVEERITDGKRIGQLLASEITGRESGVLASLSVVEADPDAEATEDGTFAYGVDAGPTRIADVLIQPARALLALQVGHETATETAEREGLSVRASDPVVCVETGAQVKAAVAVLVAAGQTATPSE